MWRDNRESHSQCTVPGIDDGFGPAIMNERRIISGRLLERRIFVEDVLEANVWVLEEEQDHFSYRGIRLFSPWKSGGD
jgi:hypothetical protein